MGTSYDAIERNFSKCVLPLLGVLGLVQCAFMIAEDGTGAQKRLGIVVEGSSSLAEAAVMAYGLNGGSLRLDSVEQLAAAVCERGLATTLYVICLIPLIKGAPAIPIVVDANNNAFTSTDVKRTIFNVLRVLKKHGLRGSALGGVSDGDARLRSWILTLMFHAGSVADAYIRVNHPFIQLAIPWIRGYGFYFKTSDWMHIAWRIRTNFLSDWRELSVGDVSIDWRKLDWTKLPLEKLDLDRSEKQHHKGVLRLAGVDEYGRTNSDIIEKVRTSHPGIAQYFSFLRFFIQIFISSEDIAVKIKMAGYVLAYLALWRRMIRLSKGRRCIKLHFMTNQTYEDIVIAVSAFVLHVSFLHVSSLPQYRDTYGRIQIRLLPAYLSSVALEYLFAFCRALYRTITSFGAYAGKVHVDHYLWTTQLEHELGEEMPTSRRCHKRGPARLEWDVGRPPLVPENVIASLLSQGVATCLHDARTVAAMESKHPATYPIPSLDELLSEVLFSSSMRRSDVSNSDLDLAAGEGPGGAFGDDDLDGYDSDDDLSGNNRRDDSTDAANAPAADQDDDNDDSGNESDHDEVLPGNADALRKLCADRGIGVSGSVRIMQNRLRAHASLNNDAASVAAAAAAGTHLPPRNRKQTKRDEHHQRLIHAVECSTDSLEHNCDSCSALEKKLRHFARQLNAFVFRISRERAGSRNRFVESGVRADDRGSSSVAAGPVLPITIIPESEAVNVVRLCKRLRNGGNLPNCKRMAIALGLNATGDRDILITLIELRLREVG